MGTLVETLKGWASRVRGGGEIARVLPNEDVKSSSELGVRATPENSIDYMYRIMWVDPTVRQAVLDIRDMDRKDGRVKRIHSRVARDVIKGGLVFSLAGKNESLSRLWDDFQRRLQLNRAEKLRSDARGLIMEGNLPLQWVMDREWNVVSAVRMPSETILPDVDLNGRFKDVTKAYLQLDPIQGKQLATFPLWQLFLARFDPDNFDDMGAMGRPFLDASRTTWKKLRMTEEDLVIRRRVRAPLRLAHVLEGATQAELNTYRTDTERNQAEITTDFFLNRKGGVSAIQGDAALDQINDITYLLDTFFAGTPLPKGLMGYTDNMARDILNDLKQDYYEEVDSMQEVLAFAYVQGFMLHCMLRGINVDAEDFTLKFSERKTETPNQTADRGLKLQALGLPPGMVWEELGYDPAYVKQRAEAEAKDRNPYPDPNAIAPQGVSSVKITPGNAPQGESATSISNPKPAATLSEHWSDPEEAQPLADAIKALGETAIALANRPAPPAPTLPPTTIHLHESPAPAPAAPAPTPIQLTAEIKLPEGLVTLPEMPAPHVTVHVPPHPESAPPVVQVEVYVPPVPPTPVTLEATLPTPEITLKLPPRKTETTVNRDPRTGEMTGSTATETDAE